MKKLAVIVDAYSSGNLFAPALQRRGFNVVHVQSAREIPADFASSFRAQDFRHSYTFDGNLNELVRTIAALKPVCVIAGSELGVTLADRLAWELGVPGNAIWLTEARRDKYQMIEALRSKGLLTAEQLCTDSLSDLIHWAKARPLPVVVKPLSSAGTDGVFICRDLTAVIYAFHQIQGATNRLGIKNEQVLIQTFLDGPEFIVDTVSANGEIIVTDICEYEKSTANQRERVYDRILIHDPTEPRFQELVTYFRKVLEALGLKNGPAHGEIILTSKGPALVEVGARPAGVMLPKLVKACGGYDQIEATIDALCEPNRFAKNPSIPRKSGQVVFLKSTMEGLVKRALPMHLISRLPSYFSSKMGLGKKLEKTVDLYTAPGLIYLINRDRNAMEQDYRRIRAAEAAGFYQWILQ